MTKVIEAVYENGFLKPLEKLDLKEGQRVKVKIEKDDLEELFGILGTTRKSVRDNEEAFYEYISERVYIP